ncbi:MAG TPA: hypothetical protein VMM56_07980 [Planctomycetaceae bacterium]|nr:hypothetical protein [Planctomycetaceae bacterium]
MNTPRSHDFLLLLLCASVVAGCGRKSAAPSAPVPQTLSGMTRDRTSYTFLKWDEGLAIMLVDWCDAHHMSSSSGNGELDQRNGDAYWWDKVSDEWKEGYEWQLETSDGQTAKITINDVQYDLAKGAVFRIDTGGDGATVTQISRDLSNIQPNRNSCDRFITSTSELKNASPADHAVHDANGDDD